MSSSKVRHRERALNSKRNKVAKSKRTKEKHVKSVRKESSSDDDDDDDNDNDVGELIIEDRNNGVLEEEDEDELSSDEAETADQPRSYRIKKEIANENEQEDDDDEGNDEFVNNIGIKCDVCFLFFTSKEQFDTHYFTAHNKGPVYQCTFCNKTYSKYTTFRSHRNRHIHERRYK